MFSAKDLFFASPAGGYTIAKSLRFRSSASAYLNRTPGSAGNRKTWTWSGWVKRGNLSAANTFLVAGYNTAPWFIAQFQSTSEIQISVTAGTSNGLVTNAVFRDPSAWYHIVIAFDTTQATQSNRVKLYVNNVQQTFSNTNYPSQNTDYQINNTVSHLIGGYGSEYFDGYMAEVNFIDGQALTPSDFGQTDTATGVWSPKAYSGTGYGTNGFYLKFTDVGATSGSNAGYGKDFAGTNYWTTNNFGTTSTATTYDSMYDTPTNYDNDVTGAGNYCVLNPVNKGSNISLTAANLDWSNTTADAACLGTIGVTSGKWYWEFTASSASGLMGIATASASLTAAVGANANGWGYLGSSGNKYTNNTSSAYGSTYTTNDVVAVAFDATNGALYFGKISSGTITWQNSGDPTSGATATGAAFTGLTSGPYFPAVGNNGASGSMNFGQRPFSASALPSGFKALNTQNLPTPTIGATSSTLANKYFDISLYTGTGNANGDTLAVTNSGSFQPDFVWTKDRASTGTTLNDYHLLADVLRGAGVEVNSNTTAAEYSGNQISAFNSNGFTARRNTTYNQNNINGISYVGWQWKANGSGSSNTSGTITSTVSANVTAGFSVVTYTTPASFTNATVGHGLGVSPAMIIVKSRGAVGSWPIWHKSLGSTDYLLLNTTDAKATSANMFNGVSSTTYTIGTSGNWGGNATYVAYCFAEVAGYSKFGSYTSNGVSGDGTFVYTGFRPRYLLFKRSNTTGDWWIIDSSRNTYNVANTLLYANLSDADTTGTVVDLLSNGFKIRAGANALNNSGDTIIYACFAEAPFNYARAR